MSRKLMLIAVLLLALPLAVAAQGDKSYSADRFDVAVNAQADGSLAVDEAVTFRFVGGPFSYVFRELPTEFTDGITEIVAGVDGIPWPQGTGPGQVEISGQNPVVITWHLSPTADTTQTFTLSYRALGVVRQGTEADVLDWQALPDEYEYTIASSRVSVSYPASAQLNGQPQVLAGKADAATTGAQAVFTQGNLSAGDPLVVRLTFTPDSFGGAPPAWQARTESQNSRAWIWVTAAAATLIGGLVAAFGGARAYQSKARKATSYLHRPPFDLPPALAAFLFNQTVSWQHGLGTLFDLASRGLIRIEETSEKKWYRSADFDVTLVDRPADLRLHEQALVDILFSDKSGAFRDTLSLSDMGQLITSGRWKGFTDSVKDEAKAQGLLDANAQRRGKQLVIWGVALTLLALAVAVMTFVAESLFGFWPLLLAGAFFFAGLFLMIAGATVSPLSAQGTQLATTFDPFRRFIKDAAKGAVDIPDVSYYESYLPYATAFGYAESWVKQQAKSGYNVAPSFFRAINAADASHMMVVYMAAITAATNSGGAAGASAAGAAGAAAAGGGASGAG